MSDYLSCLRCGDSFVAKGKKKYCSEECRIAHSLVPADLHEINCVICDKIMVVPGKKLKKYCSKKCKVVAAQSRVNHIRAPADSREANCVVCDKAIIVVGLGNKKYCSEECRTIATKARYVPVAPRETVCVTCNKSIIVTGSRKFCSEECANQFCPNPFTCLICESVFNKKRPDHVYCSDICSRISRWDKSKINFHIDVCLPDEKSFHHWFEHAYPLFGIRRILANSSACPDLIVEMHDGSYLRVELEYHANNFKHHSHNPCSVDLIIAYLKTTSVSHVCGVPVLALYNVRNHKQGTTFFDLTTRSMTNELSEICEYQSKIIHRMINQS